MGNEEEFGGSLLDARAVLFGIFCFCWNNSKLDEHFVNDGKEGGFNHGTSLDSLVDRDDFVKLFDFFTLVESVEEKFNFVFEFGREGIALSAWHARTSAGADCDEFCRFGANLSEFFFLLLGID